MNVFSNLPSDSVITPDGVNGGIVDPNHMQAPNQSAGGATKVNKTDLSGPSGVQQGANFADSSQSSKDFFMPSPAPGNGSGALTDNKGTGNSSGIPAATPVEPLLFGDPNNTAVDYKDNYQETSSDKEGRDFTGTR